jgi:hypothetical protein
LASSRPRTGLTFIHGFFLLSLRSCAPFSSISTALKLGRRFSPDAPYAYAARSPRRAKPCQRTEYLFSALPSQPRADSTSMRRAVKSHALVRLSFLALLRAIMQWKSNRGTNPDGRRPLFSAASGPRPHRWPPSRLKLPIAGSYVPPRQPDAESSA